MLKKIPADIINLPEYGEVNNIQQQSWLDRMLRSNNGTPKPSSVENVRLVLENDQNMQGILQYDQFAGRVMKPHKSEVLKTDAGEWTDSDDARLRLYIEKKYRFSPTRDSIFDAVTTFAEENGYNPVKQRIETQKWDGKPRVEHFFIDYLGAENSHYVKTVTKKWLVGAIARVYKPGIKFELVPILQGDQGLGKSWLCSLLYKDYFLDTLGSLGKTKDDYQQLVGRWIVEIGELSAMKKTDTEKIKGFISAQNDHYRDSYARRATDHPRKCVFVGTSNPSEYLKDKTGNRRFMPIKCGINQPIKDVFNADDNDILQTLAEAKIMFDHGEVLFLDDETVSEAEKAQQDAVIEDPNETIIRDYLNMPVPRNWDEYSVIEKRTYFKNYADSKIIKSKTNVTIPKEKCVPLDRTTAKEILQVAFGMENKQIMSASRGNFGRIISLVLDQQKSWEKQKIRLDGRQVRIYQRKL